MLAETANLKASSTGDEFQKTIIVKAYKIAATEHLHVLLLVLAGVEQRNTNRGKNKQ